MERYICIHGHFYQPPRENPWLEAIEVQDTACPFHDWNERINVECYAPNAVSRIMGSEGKVGKIVNNYTRISHNFGPTLLDWLEKHDVETYQMIIGADAESKTKFSGHGSALAQTYNHMIMPLASARDKVTQIRWGVQDFLKRYGRLPEGIWLSETAVDLETLSICADVGILFTILSPHQAKQIRPIGSESRWLEVGARIDPTRPYRLTLPSGKNICIFFYDAPISRGVAFEKLLSNGEYFAGRLIGGFSDTRYWPQIVNIATDGETYGHHFLHGDMALAYALEQIESKGLAKITNYGEYLEKYPPSHEVEISENTSWSCSHGIERWRSDCGCNSGGRPGWQQRWRGPLREGLDFLRDSLAPRFEDELKKIFRDPWEARNQYINVILDRSRERVERFFTDHQHRPLETLDMTEKITALKLLEMQRQAMLMYTSCGWFFDDISGIETIQCLQYAARAMQLAESVFGVNLETEFLNILKRAPSNASGFANGHDVYEKLVKPAVVTLPHVAAHYAVSSLFGSNPDPSHIYCYRVELEDYQEFEGGKAKFAVGRANITSEITWETESLSFGVLHFGHHNFSAGVQVFKDLPSYQMMVKNCMEAFTRVDFPQVIRLMDRYFESWNFALQRLFRNEQRSILDKVLGSTLSEIESTFSRIFDNNYPLIRFLVDLKTPLPDTLKAVTSFVKNMELSQLLSAEYLEQDAIQALLEEVKEYNITLDIKRLNHAFTNTLEGLMTRFEKHPENILFLRNIHDNARFIQQLPFTVSVWRLQNKFHQLLGTIFPKMKQNVVERKDKEAEEWVRLFVSLGQALWVKME